MMKDLISKIYEMIIKDSLFLNRMELAYLEKPVMQTVQIIAETFKNGRQLLICGNGGSSSDSDHIVGELMKSFEIPRPLEHSVQVRLKEQFGKRGALLADNLQRGIPAISLSAHTSLITAITNDIGGDYIFAQQIASYGKPGDVLLAISTSGNSQNVIDAMITAKAVGLTTIGLTGEAGGAMKDYCEVLINVPAQNTAAIQEYHLPIFHLICRNVEQQLFGDSRKQFDSQSETYNPVK